MYGLRLESIAFSLGPISVHWYGIILGTAALLGLLLAVQEGKRFGLSADFFMDLVLFGVPSAIIGARIYFVAFKWDEYKDHLVDVFKIWNGGIAIYGALIGAFICGYIYSRIKGYSLWRIADICAPGLIVGQLIGRWGNFVNQEAYGGPVEESFLRNTLHLPSWIVNQMNVEGVFHHPTFLYESLWNLVGLIVLLVLRRRSFVRVGEILLSYFIWYSIGRFFIEGLRTDSLAFQGASWVESLMNGLWSPMTIVFEHGYLNPAEGNVRISQLISVVLIIVAVTLIIVRRKNGAAKEHYSDPIINYKTGLPAGVQAPEKTAVQTSETARAKIDPPQDADSSMKE
ncbi:prolipoprotein diacylglyceryl transferase [Paenibacillus baekrokdamisoli]|uniref:Phosphatidylglycerol--prolipoprotein diacylglyceryl transferase n=1 Tax=Paenibacillus baekrokdamisoli TaxID=1712516 RepID=A0A3G9JJG4_9BACL|nr:prolipoprotein diacylglyceryl transferase [Paenibacillus baekrokdamisoli]MBB3067809.1 phosphatidylglycerol:prolipoprotein diacylglycerol transferase [Paenibacillus baekrokdamisoli]BBH23149.1 prolipoprotein diacylglyceryl transferase [Paenibacillus baekrokdamisoli]